MTNFFEYLKLEHSKIEAVLRAFKGYILSISGAAEFDAVEFRDFITFFDLYADKIHHGKEEDILFPAAYRSGLGHKSGSKCTLFFGLFLDNNYLDEVRADLVGYDPPLAKYAPKPILHEIIENKSPLVIPLEEHEIGFYSMQIMVSELGKKGEPGWNRELLLRTARRYVNMLESHIEKEDECLFPMLVQNLGAPIASALLSEFETFDQMHSAVHIQATAIYDRIMTKYPARG